ncbi:sporulation YhaL family protein [Virgibacillus ainsalahensis]
MILGMPWWVLMVIFLIFLSGSMAFRAMQAERELLQESIEREGRVYMDRLEEEKAKRQQQRSN